MVYMNIQNLIDKYYVNRRILLHPLVLSDILNEIVKNPETKMLVFGLANDGQLWYNATNKNTYFVEKKNVYLSFNHFIPDDNIIEYSYKGMSVRNSYILTKREIESFTVPDKLKKLAPFDIILIDAPQGHKSSSSGRLLPIHWSIHSLSKKGTLIYLDDYNRQLETFCINKYCKNNVVKVFKERYGCVKCKM